MSEEQLKAAVEPTEQVEEGVEEISEEDLEGVAGGATNVKTYVCPSITSTDGTSNTIM